MPKSVERSCHRKVLRRVAGLLAPLGFRRGKPAFIIRQHDWVIQFIQLHKYFSASGFRIHLGIRVLNDVFPAPALTSPGFGQPLALCWSTTPSWRDYWRFSHFSVVRIGKEPVAEVASKFTCSPCGEQAPATTSFCVEKTDQRPKVPLISEVIKAVHVIRPLGKNFVHCRDST
jgi:hypothetical protein